MQDSFTLTIILVEMVSNNSSNQMEQQLQIKLKPIKNTRNDTIAKGKDKEIIM